MAAAAQSTLESIERRRVQLQENIDKLRNALTHWTTWEAEYQILQEELESAQDASPDQIREIAGKLNNTLLDEKEVEELLGKDRQTKRTANQVVDLISRRIDYVQQNSSTIEKQLDTVEKKLAGVDVLLEPGMENEEGLPMMDIEEQLDDDGNELSSSVNQTGKAAAEIVEALRKAGIKKAGLEKATVVEKVQSNASEGTLEPASLVAGPAREVTQSSKDAPRPVPSDANSTADVSSTTVTLDKDSNLNRSNQKSALEKNGYNDALADVNWTRGTKVIELDQDDNEVASYPIIPQGESPEDAELRRQMLQYGLSEVGQIVAELDLDHPTVDYDDDDDDDDYEYGTEDEEDEDEYGRSTKSMITDDYRKQMLELEKKLNARMMENVGPQSDENLLAEHAEDIRTLRIRKDADFDGSLDTTAASPTKMDSKKKGVRFADELDVSEAPNYTALPSNASAPPRKSTSTISDKIVERPASTSDTPVAPPKPTKVSRFKSARASSNQTPKVLPTPPIPEPPPVPTGPSGRTLASTIVEHEPTAAEPNAPDEFDPVLLNRQIQTEYHKARNKFIQQQGGFKAVDDEDEDPIVEEKDGKTKKVSRFMAAKLKANGM